MLSYNIYLFITRNSGENFGITKLQINNTFNIKIKAFMKKKKIEIIETKFRTKTITILKTKVLKDFNDSCMTIKIESIIVIYKNQAEKFVFINIKDNVKK